jgi:hypothetical protein
MTDRLFDCLLALDIVQAAKAKQCADRIKSPALKPIADSFAKNVSNLGIMVATPDLAVAVALLAWEAGAFTQSVGGLDAFTSLLASLSQKTKDQALSRESLNQLLAEDPQAKPMLAFLERLAHYTEHPPEVVQQTRDSAEYQAYVKVQRQATTALAWTAFESASCDAWVTALNAAPRVFGMRALKKEAAEEGTEVEGLTQKTIEFGLLAKYDFDLRHCLGTVLQPKFNLSTLENIERAYLVAFAPASELQPIFGSRDLKRLEASRHNIVHRAGIVDDRFLRRAKALNVECTLNAELQLDHELVATLVNAGIAAGCDLLQFVDDRLADTRPEGPAKHGPVS